MPKVLAIVDDIAVTAATVRWPASGDGWAIFKISGTRSNLYYAHLDKFLQPRE
jgi:hypothetical protein